MGFFKGSIVVIWIYTKAPILLFDICRICYFSGSIPVYSVKAAFFRKKPYEKQAAETVRRLFLFHAFF